MSIKLVSVNIEGQKHLDKIREFLAREKADVVCMMEVFEDTLDGLSCDYPYVESAWGYLADQDREKVIEGRRRWGEVIMSKYPLHNVNKTYLGPYDKNHLAIHGQDTHAPVLIVADVISPNGTYKIATVHGTWTKGGLVNERQRSEMGKIIQILSGQEVVLCGDFNIPRGNELYKIFAENFKDNIPNEVQTTLDPVLHYGNREEVGRLKFVVDYAWSTKRYKVLEVQIVSGVSDHCALVCTIC
ncbi:MAG: endonuclease/exonuclease/phosphatase family protein [Microgenomates group bacterium]